MNSASTTFSSFFGCSACDCSPDAARTTIVVYNWDEAETVDVDLASVLAPGDRYELHNVQDYAKLRVLLVRRFVGKDAG